MKKSTFSNEQDNISIQINNMSLNQFKEEASKQIVEKSLYKYDVKKTPSASSFGSLPEIEDVESTPSSFLYQYKQVATSSTSSVGSLPEIEGTESMINSNLKGALLFLEPHAPRIGVIKDKSNSLSVLVNTGHSPQEVELQGDIDLHNLPQEWVI